MIPSMHRMVRYNGRSMWPCFQEGDLLEVEAVAARTVRVGDCVLLRCTDNTCIAHRVIRIQGGLCTRGDAMPQTDTHLSGEPELIGRIRYRYRFGQMSRVANGRAGQLAGRFYYYAGRIDPERQGRIGALARGVRRLCRPLMHKVIPWGTPRYLSLPGREKLVVWGFGRKLVAQKQSITGAWQICWPWRIVVTLPDNSL